jgi:hypothetical protein
VVFIPGTPFHGVTASHHPTAPGPGDRLAQHAAGDQDPKVRATAARRRSASLQRHGGPGLWDIETEEVAASKLAAPTMTTINGGTPSG